MYAGSLAGATAEKRREKGLPLFQRVEVYTDRCPTQYVCKENFEQIATFPARHNGMAMMQGLKNRHDGKCSCDSESGCFKCHCTKTEVVRGARLSTPLILVDHAQDDPEIAGPSNHGKKWHRLAEQRDRKYLKKPLHVIMDRRFVYMADSKEEYEKATEEYPGIRMIHFTDRTKRFYMTGRLHETQQIHKVYSDDTPQRTTKLDAALASALGLPRAERVEAKLIVAKKMCACDTCLQRQTGTGTCQNSHIRQEKECWVPVGYSGDPSAETNKSKKTAAAKEFYKSIADNLGIKLRELSDEFLKQLQGRMGFWIAVGEGKIENALQVYSILQHGGASEKSQAAEAAPQLLLRLIKRRLLRTTKCCDSEPEETGNRLCCQPSCSGDCYREANGNQICSQPSRRDGASATTKKRKRVATESTGAPSQIAKRRRQTPASKLKGSAVGDRVLLPRKERRPTLNTGKT